MNFGDPLEHPFVERLHHGRIGRVVPRLQSLFHWRGHDQRRFRADAGFHAQPMGEAERVAQAATHPLEHHAAADERLFESPPERIRADLADKSHVGPERGGGQRRSPRRRRWSRQ